MSKAMKIILLVIFLVLSARASVLFKELNAPTGIAAASLLTVVFIVAIIITAVSRGESRR